MSEVKFIDGLSVKAPHENAPDFVKGKISIKRADLGNWLRGQTDEWINADIKVSKAGKWYVAIDDWKPDISQRQDMKQAPQSAPPADFDDSDLPFLSVPRLSLAIITFTFVVYLIPGMFGAPLKALSGWFSTASAESK